MSCYHTIQQLFHALNTQDYVISYVTSVLLKWSKQLYTLPIQQCWQRVHWSEWVRRSDRLNLTFSRQCYVHSNLEPGKYSQLFSSSLFRRWPTVHLAKNCVITFSHVSAVSCVAVIHKFDYVFAENGTVQYKDGKLLSKHVSLLLLQSKEQYMRDCTTYTQLRSLRIY